MLVKITVTVDITITITITTTVTIITSLTSTGITRNIDLEIAKKPALGNDSGYHYHHYHKLQVRDSEVAKNVPLVRQAMTPGATRAARTAETAPGAPDHVGKVQTPNSSHNFVNLGRSSFKSSRQY